MWGREILRASRIFFFTGVPLYLNSPPCCKIKSIDTETVVVAAFSYLDQFTVHYVRHCSVAFRSAILRAQNASMQ